MAPGRGDVVRRPNYVNGYRVLYVDAEGNVLCGDCAAETDSQHPYWEGPDMTCDECDATIESAYGDPEVTL